MGAERDRKLGAWPARTPTTISPPTGFRSSSWPWWPSGQAWTTTGPSLGASQRNQESPVLPHRRRSSSVHGGSSFSSPWTISVPLTLCQPNPPCQVMFLFVYICVIAFVIVILYLYM